MGTEVVNVPGVAHILIAIPSGALQPFGYTANGAQVTFEGYEIRVPSDENGGDEGPPAEIQYLGQTARVRLEMTKFDQSVSELLLRRLPSGTLGQPIGTGTPAGTLLFAGLQYFRLVIASAVKPFNFPCVSILRAPQDLNVGTKYQRHVVEVECYKHPTTGILWDRTIA